jgi:hypothetical protein
VHYLSTSKKLAEEGIDSAARLRAFPTAARALLLSTGLCAGFGSLVVFGVQRLYPQPIWKSSTEVSVPGAVELASRQRQAIKRVFRDRLGAEPNDGQRT